MLPDTPWRTPRNHGAPVSVAARPPKRVATPSTAGPGGALVITSGGESARALLSAFHAAEHAVEFHADRTTVTGLRDAFSVRVTLTAIEGAELKIRLDAIGLAVETGDTNVLATPALTTDSLAIRFPCHTDVRVVDTPALGADEPVAAATAFERPTATVRHGSASAELVAGGGAANTRPGLQITGAIRVVRAMGIGAAYAGIDTPRIATAVRAFGAALPGFATPLVRIWTTHFFAIAGAVAAGAVAAFAVVGASATGIAAIRPAFAKLIRTAACPLDGDLDTGTNHRFRIWLGGPPGRLGTPRGRDRCQGRRTAEPEQPLQHVPPVPAGAERFRQQVESVIVHCVLFPPLLVCPSCGATCHVV